MSSTIVIDLILSKGPEVTSRSKLDLSKKHDKRFFTSRNNDYESRVNQIKEILKI